MFFDIVRGYSDRITFMCKIQFHPKRSLLTTNIQPESEIKSLLFATEKVSSKELRYLKLKTKLIYTISNIISRPRYFLVFALARFHLLRQIYNFCSQFNSFSRSSSSCETDTLFELNPVQAIYTLKQDGVCKGLTLPPHFLKSLLQYLNTQDCYAGGKPNLGFKITEKEQLDQLFNQPFYVARYFNLSAFCPQISQLVNDPKLQQIVTGYIGKQAQYTGSSLFWTFPIEGVSVDSDQQMFSHFHYDIDDFAGLRFCFYLTDVTLNDGPHVCIRGSHIKKPIRCILNFFSRIQTEDELAKIYDSAKFLTIIGNSGTGFIEDTFCFHKGVPPKTKPRLFLQLHFAAHNHNSTRFSDDQDAAMLCSWRKNSSAKSV